jgi:predicted RNase H-like nuclease (RuvC/YqgF family)
MATASAVKRASSRAALKEKLATTLDPQERSILESDMTSAELAAEEKVEALEEDLEKVKKKVEELGSGVLEMRSKWSLTHYISENFSSLVAALAFAGAVGFGGYWLVVVPSVNTPKIVQVQDKFCIEKGVELIIKQPDGTVLAVPEGSCASTIQKPNAPVKPKAPAVQPPTPWAPTP